MNSMGVLGQKLQICPQCGKDWGDGVASEFCSRCGSPTFNARFSFDPLKTSHITTIGLDSINRRSKAVIRWGIFGFGALCLFTGLCLFYSGWFDFEGLDPIQLWVSRLTSPLLLVQGALYCMLPFRLPKPAQVIPFRRPANR